MGILRSEELKLYQLNIPKEEAYNIVADLGNKGEMQFIDAYEKPVPQFNRPYHFNIKRIEETQIKLTEIT